MANIKWFRVFFSLGLIFSFVFFIIFLIQQNNTPLTKTIHLKNQSSVIDQAKFSVYPELLDHKLQFNLTIETYEHPSLLDINYNDIVIVQCNEQVLSNSLWTVHKKETYKTIGQLELHFNSNNFQEHCFPLKLDLYLSSVVSFTWNKENEKSLIH